jgi:hypothetical protein
MSQLSRAYYRVPGPTVYIDYGKYISITIDIYRLRSTRVRIKVQQVAEILWEE